jgi:hypothetical protein
MQKRNKCSPVVSRPFAPDSLQRRKSEESTWDAKEKSAKLTARTHRRTDWFPFTSTHLLVRLLNHEVQEHVETAQNTGDLSSCVEVDENSPVHVLCRCCSESAESIHGEGASRSCDCQDRSHKTARWQPTPRRLPFSVLAERPWTSWQEALLGCESLRSGCLCP